MSAYCYRKQFPLRYTDFDFKDELSLTSLLGIIQEAATGSADELGFGYADLKPKNYGFLVVNTYGEIYRRPVFGETLTVETWPLPPRHVFFERDYRVLGGDGQPVAAAASRWCLVDLASFSLLTGEALGEANANCPYNPEKSLSVLTWKVPRLKEGKEVYRTIARQSLCDHYLHVNNTRYADLFLDCLTMAELEGKTLRSFHIAYSKQAREGSELVLSAECGGERLLAEIECEGESLTQGEFIFAPTGKRGEKA